MKKTFLFLISVLFLSIPGTAQSQDVMEVTKAVEQLTKAMIDADNVMLDSLTSANLSYGHSSGVLEDKDQFIKALTSGESNFISIDLREPQIQIIDNVAIVRHKLAAQIHNKGSSPASINLSVLQVWQKTNKTWKLLARHASKI